LADTNPARAIGVVKRVAMMGDFIEHAAIKTAVEEAVPITMPREVGALGFDIPLWVGLGMVGLWAALDGFAERAALPRPQCATCGRRCILARFASNIQGNENVILGELEDLRHLYAHNFAGEADEVYFDPRQKRHLLARGSPVALTCGAQFDGQRVQLNLSHLRMYLGTVQSLLERFQ
jgi:hypothetical protein